MLISVKDILKLFGISIVTFCAAFVCTLFLSYNIDITSVKDALTSDSAIVMYNALITTGKITAAVSGGCLVATSVVLLLFYVKNYIDSHGHELGILKALGCPNIKTALKFWVFGLSVFVGCVLGYISAYLYLPAFYAVQNAENIFPEIAVGFHVSIPLCLVLAPSAAFAAIAVIYAWYKLKKPPLELLKGGDKTKRVSSKRDGKERPFLVDLKINTLRGKKSSVFFVAFSAFCFAAMVQMSASMKELASESMAVMIMAMGLTLAFVTLLLSLTGVIKENAKTAALLRAFGYSQKERSRAVLGAFRPVSYIGFAVGTLYQYGLLKIMVTVVFSELENVVKYGFDFIAFVITLIAFVAVYELIMFAFSLKLNKTSLKKIMTE